MGTLMNCVIHKTENGLTFDVTGISLEISKAIDPCFWGVCGGKGRWKVDQFSWWGNSWSVWGRWVGGYGFYILCFILDNNRLVICLSLQSAYSICFQYFIAYSLKSLGKCLYFYQLLCLWGNKWFLSFLTLHSFGTLIPLWSLDKVILVKIQ